MAIKAQEPFFINYSITEGLPSNTIYSSFQDKEGYLWFASDVGVIKYDSKAFKLYNTDDGLSDNEVFQIKEDYKGRKWLLTLNGIPSIISKNTIYNDTNSELIKRVKSNSMLIDFFEDAENNIHLTYRKGEVVTIKPSDEITKKNLDKTTVCGTWSYNNDIYTLTSAGLWNLTKNHLKPNKDYHNSLRVYHQENQTYYSTENTLFKVESNAEITQLLTVDDTTEIINIYTDTSSKSWICTRNGLYQFDKKKQLNHYFKGNIITSLIEDIEGNYWATSLNKGLFFIPSFNINQLQHKGESIKVNTIAVKSNQEIWLGGTKNNYYQMKGEKLTAFNLNKSWRRDNIANIRFNNDDIYVIGKSGLIIHQPNSKTELSISLTDALIYEDQLLTATNYLSKIKLSDVNKNISNSIRSNRLLNVRTNNLTKGKDNDVWIGTNAGLYKYTQNDSIIFLGDAYKDLTTPIEDLYYDKDQNRLLVASSSKGLIVIDKNESFKTISQKNGINNNTCNSIEKMDNNTYLIGTNKGLNTLYIKNDSLNVKSFNTAIGFKNKKINDIAFSNDTIYLATTNELIYFNKNYLNQKTAKPISKINNLLINNKVAHTNQIPYKDNDVSISYSGISFIDQGNVTYFFKLNEPNSEWNQTKETQINYKSLSPKNYTFSLYCVNGFGEKSDIQTISFSVLKPFWQQLWFYILIATLSVFLVLSLWNYRLKYLNKQFEKERKNLALENEKILMENQMLGLEQKALRLQMNPHFMFNALNCIKGYYSIGDAEKANNYIEKFSKLLRMLLEIEEQTTTLENELEMLNLYLELNAIRYTNKFDYRITVANNINPSEISIPSLLLQPLVENAILHGLVPKLEKGLLTISFSIRDSNLFCVVEDNGIGRVSAAKIKKKNEHESKALTITKERLYLFDKHGVMKFIDLYNDEKPIGTKVTIETKLKFVY